MLLDIPFLRLVLTRGVKKNRGTGTGTGKQGNRKIGNRETGVPIPVSVWKNQKPGTLVSVPGFYWVTGNRVKYIFFI
jgi:hypothetical protein